MVFGDVSLYLNFNAMKDALKKIYRIELRTAIYCVIAATITLIIIIPSIKFIIIGSIKNLLLFWKFKIDRKQKLIKDFKKYMKSR